MSDKKISCKKRFQQQQYPAFFHSPVYFIEHAFKARKMFILPVVNNLHARASAASNMFYFQKNIQLFLPHRLDNETFNSETN